MSDEKKRPRKKRSKDWASYSSGTMNSTLDHASKKIPAFNCGQRNKPKPTLDEMDKYQR